MAHAIKDLPMISEQFRQGKVSYSKVRAITRVASVENEEYLLKICRYGTAAHVERLVRNYKQVKRNEALARDNERHVLRQLDWYFDDDDSLVIKARFTPEQGMLIKKVLESIIDEDFLEQKDVSAETPVDELKLRTEPISQRRADALFRMAEAYSSTSGIANSGDRYLVHVHTDMETLKVDGTGAESEIDEGSNVSAETSRRLACDAGVVYWLENKEGFAIHSRADGRIYFTDPQGRHLPDAGDTRFSGNVFSLTTVNSRSGIHITPETGKCQWGGEKMDDDLAILCMLQLE